MKHSPNPSHVYSQQAVEFVVEQVVRDPEHVIDRMIEISRAVGSSRAARSSRGVVRLGAVAFGALGKRRKTDATRLFPTR